VQEVKKRKLMSAAKYEARILRSGRDYDVLTPLPTPEDQRILSKRKRYMCCAGRPTVAVTRSPSITKSVIRARIEAGHRTEPGTYCGSVIRDRKSCSGHGASTISNSVLSVWAVSRLYAQLSPHPPAEMSSMNFKSEPESTNSCSQPVYFQHGVDDQSAC